MNITQNTWREHRSGDRDTGTIRILLKTLALSSVLLMAACTSVAPTPYLSIQAAENAIDNADQERVSDYAIPELGEARNKLAASRAAVQNEEMDLAKNLAEESRVSAELASAKAGQIKAEQINDDVKKSIRTLKQEMQRNSGELQ